MKVGTNKQRARTIELVPGKHRTSIKFDTSTWAAIDLIAARKRVKWQEWARDVVAAHPDTKNKAGAIRAAMTDELLGEIANSVHRCPAPDIKHPMLAGFSVASEADLLLELKAVRIEYECDFGAFVFRAGYRAQEHGEQPVLFFENKLRGELSVVLTQSES